MVTIIKLPKPSRMHVILFGGFPLVARQPGDSNGCLDAGMTSTSKAGNQEEEDEAVLMS